jgi:dTDP-4-amino-4,6-dideoxygalactose transaminase
MAAIAALSDEIGPRTAVLLPSFTFPATAQAALWFGLRPRFLDIATDHWHLDPLCLEEELASAGTDVGLVIAVSAFGTPPPSAVRRRWQHACDAAGVPLVVDSAAGFGAVADDGTPIGAQGTVEVVSFHATKPFAIGEGGAVFTRDASVATRVERAINFGYDQGHRIAAPLALNGKMSELHAATALAVLDRYDSILQGRRERAREIVRSVGQAARWQAGCDRSTWQFVPVALATPRERDDRLAASDDRVELRTYYEPLHRIPAFAGASTGSQGLGRTEDLADRILSLPMANDLTPAEMSMVVDVLLASSRPSDATR